MMRSTTIYVRIDPHYWWDTDFVVRDVKFGPIRKTRPPRDEQANWVAVDVEVDDERFNIVRT